jgi:addiction module HigA family antidote
MLMHNPPHPGEILRDECLEPLGLSVTAVAKALGVSRKTLSALLNGHAGISPEMAIRLSIAFDTTAESWLQQQLHYELWQAEQHRDELDVKKLAIA